MTSMTLEVCVGALHLGQGLKAAPGVLDVQPSSSS